MNGLLLIDRHRDPESFFAGDEVVVVYAGVELT
jgi:hypothetical protein